MYMRFEVVYKFIENYQLQDYPNLLTSWHFFLLFLGGVVTKITLYQIIELNAFQWQKPAHSTIKPKQSEIQIIWFWYVQTTISEAFQFLRNTTDSSWETCLNIKKRAFGPHVQKVYRICVLVLFNLSLVLRSIPNALKIRPVDTFENKDVFEYTLFLLKTTKS